MGDSTGKLSRRVWTANSDGTLTPIQDERTALWPYESLGLPTHWSKRKRTLYALPFYDFDLRASHARTLMPAALASVPFGFVLVRVRVPKTTR